MWDEVDEETGDTRERELKGVHWKAMIDRHSSTGRFVGTRDSALRLIDPIVNDNKPKAKGEGKNLSEILPIGAKYVKTEELEEQDVVIA